MSKLEKELGQKLKKISEKSVSPTVAIMRSRKTEVQDEKTNESKNQAKVNTEDKNKEETKLQNEDKKNDRNNKKNPSKTQTKSKDLKINELFFKEPTIEETHTRRTFLIRNDLIERLDDTSNKPENFTKTKFINYILEKGLDELEGVQDGK